MFFCHDKKLWKPSYIGHIELYHLVRSFPEWVESLALFSLPSSSVQESCADSQTIMPVGLGLMPEAQKLPISKAWKIFETSAFSNASWFRINCSSPPLHISILFLTYWFCSQDIAYYARNCGQILSLSLLW